MSTYIDDLYTLSASVEGAVCMLEDAEEFLNQHWALTLKPDSKLVTSSANGALFSDADDCRGFKYVANFSVLGRIICNSGSLAPAFAVTEKKMWAGFWGNAGSARAKT